MHAGTENVGVAACLDAYPIVVIVSYLWDLKSSRIAVVLFHMMPSFVLVAQWSSAVLPIACTACLQARLFFPSL